MVLALAASTALTALIWITASAANNHGVCQTTCTTSGYSMAEAATSTTCTCWTPVVLGRLGAGGDKEETP